MNEVIRTAFIDEMEKIALVGELAGGLIGGTATEALGYSLLGGKPRFLRSVAYGIPGDLAGAMIGHHIEQKLRRRKRRREREKRAYAWGNIGRKSMWSDAAGSPMKTNFRGIGNKPPKMTKIKDTTAKFRPPKAPGTTQVKGRPSVPDRPERNNMADLLKDPFNA